MKGLIGFYKLENWYQSSFDESQRQRLRDIFNHDDSVNKYGKWQNSLDKDEVKFEAQQHEWRFLYDMLLRLQAKRNQDLYIIVEDLLKSKIRTIYHIDDERWHNEKYYKSWFILRTYDFAKISRLQESSDYMPYVKFNPVKDMFTSDICKELSKKVFLINSYEFNLAYEKHFKEPIQHCRCCLMALKSPLD